MSAGLRVHVFDKAFNGLSAAQKTYLQSMLTDTCQEKMNKMRLCRAFRDIISPLRGNSLIYLNHVFKKDLK